MSRQSNRNHGRTSGGVSDDAVRIAQRLVEINQAKRGRDFKPQPRKPVTLPEISIQKQASLDRIKEYKIDRREQAIRAMENNRSRLIALRVKLEGGQFPGTTSHNYNPSSHCLTIKYIAMSVQWYAHRDMLYIQEGNDKKWHMLCDIVTLEHKLEQGRRGFQ